MKTLITFMLLSTILTAKTYTVSKSLTFTNASKIAIAGDSIIVPDGIYVNEFCTLKNSGTAKDPIVIIGDGMPTLDGLNRASGRIAINIIGNYIIIKNIKIKNYTYGINTASSNHLLIENIIVQSIGNVNSAYSGKGIQLGSTGVSEANYNQVIDCRVINSAAEGISVNGNYNHVANCYVACNEGVVGSNNSAATDYYIIVNGNYNRIRGCTTERIGNISHLGHGIGLKYKCENNTIDKCASYNMGSNFYVRHRGVKRNTFSNCKAYRGISGFTVRDGASYNNFVNCYDTASYSGIRFFDTVEDGGAQYCGRNNNFDKCYFVSNISGIYFDEFSVQSLADSNLISNCQFKSVTYLFETQRENRNNRLINCTFTNVLKYVGGKFPVNADVSYSSFVNVQFLAPKGINNVKK